MDSANECTPVLWHQWFIHSDICFSLVIYQGSVMLWRAVLIAKYDAFCLLNISVCAGNRQQNCESADDCSARIFLTLRADVKTTLSSYDICQKLHKNCKKTFYEWDSTSLMCSLRCAAKNDFISVIPIIIAHVVMHHFPFILCFP